MLTARPMAPPMHKLHPMRAMAVCLALAGLAALVPTTENIVVYALALALLLCFLIPLWRAWNRGRLDFFEPIHVIGGFNVIYFGLGGIWSIQDPFYVAYDPHLIPYIPRAMFYCVLGYLAVLVGYYGPWRERREARPVEEQLTGVTFLVIPGVLGLVGYVIMANLSTGIGGGISGAVGSLSQLSPLFLFAWALAWVLFFSKRITRGQRAILFGLLLPGALLVAYLTISNKSLGITLAGLPFVSFWYARRKLPWVTLTILLLLVVFVIFPVYNTYRYTDPHLSQTQRMSLTYRAIDRWDMDQYMQGSLGLFKRRMALINSVAIVIRDTPRWVPYAKGSTIFGPTIASFVPRVLWPDKPAFNQGREFGQTFRVFNFLAAEGTWVASSIPGGLYWNFDLPGILIGMLIWGVGMRFLYRRYGESTTLDPVRRATFLVFLVHFAHMEGSLAPMIVTLVRTFVMLEAMRWVGRQYGLLELRRPADAG